MPSRSSRPIQLVRGASVKSSSGRSRPSSVAPAPAQAPTTPIFRFDRDAHEYWLDDRQLPHITGMLEQTGHVDPRWYTDESRRRGTEVHHLTALYDLGALDPVQTQSAYKGWLLAHVESLRILRPKFDHIEEPLYHPWHFYAGTPDRVGIFDNRLGVWEIKSGAYEKAHQIQTALQAMLVGAEYRMRPQFLARYCLYLRENGKYKVEEFVEMSDFDEAAKVIEKCCLAF